MQLAEFLPGATPSPATRLTETAGRRMGVLPTVDPSVLGDWDKQVDRHPAATFFHGAAWVRVLQKAYAFKPAFFTTVERDGVPVVLPLIETESWLAGRRGIGLPFADEAAPLCSEPDAAQPLIKAAMEWGRQRKWKSIELRGGRELFPDAPASMSFYGHTVNLAGDEQQMFSRLDDSVRRAIRKAEKAGLAVTISRDLDAMKIFYRLQCLTRRKHGLPPQPFAFFRAILEEILAKDQGMIVLVRSANRAVAASVYFYRGQRATYKYGASDEACQQLRGSNLVMWEAIKWLASRGFRTLHLGRTSLANEGLRRFKLNWGADESKMDYVKYDFRRNAWITETDRVTGWHNRVFRALPLGASRLIGGVLYRHLA